MSRGVRAVVPALLILGACGGPSAAPPTAASAAAVDNMLPIEVTTGPANNTVNGLFASVTICVPGTANCQTIDGVQIDTGSSGLRLLSSAISLSLPSVKDAGGHPIGNCATFADQSYTWGPVMTADVLLAGEKAASVPIQVIAAPGFPGAPGACSNGGTASGTVAALSAQGLLGIGVFRQDCGPACSGGLSAPPPVYFSCSGVSCSVSVAPLESQLQNPVWLFPQDNNGVVVSLPAVPPTGAPSLSGSLIFGIGTQSNNALGSAQVYATDGQGNFSTSFKGRVYPNSFLDTGSNGLYFLDDSTIGLPACPGEDSGYSCPPATVDFTAINVGANGTSGPVSFSVANAESLFSTGNVALGRLGGPDTGDFDWGLPFFFGRTTATAIEGQPTSWGPGPYWAY
jgi:hypothetical protein